LAARADTRVVHALGGRQAVDGLALFAGEAAGTIPIFYTLPSAEVPFLAIVHADVFSGAYTLAIVPRRARLAEVGVFGDADEDDVRVGAPDLLALPAGRAFLLARFGAHSLAHVLYTPPRLALAVFGTVVEEASLSWVAGRSRKVGGDIDLHVSRDIRSRICALVVGKYHDIYGIDLWGCLLGLSVFLRCGVRGWSRS